MIRKILFICVLFSGFLSTAILAGEPKSLGKYKNWEAFTYDDNGEKIKALRIHLRLLDLIY